MTAKQIPEPVVLAPARGFTRRSTHCRRFTALRWCFVTSRACHTSRPQAGLAAPCERSRAGSCGRRSGSASGSRAGSELAFSPSSDCESALAPSAAWVQNTAAGARAFAAGQSPLATAGVSAATISLARSTLRAAVLVPRLIAGAILTAGFAVVVVAAARGWFRFDPPRAPLQASEPRVVAQPKKDPNNRRSGPPHRQSRFPGAHRRDRGDRRDRFGARAGLGGEPEVMTRLATNPDGTCTIEFPRVLPKEIYVTARKPGFACRSYGPLLEPGGAGIASDHTIEMESGVTIGGVVKNHDGRAITGATVIIMARAGADNSPDWTWVPGAKVTTDTQGRWRYGEMPSGWRNVYITVTHPDYVSTFMQREVPTPSDLMLKARKAEMTLDEGLHRGEGGRPEWPAARRCEDWAGIGSPNHAERFPQHDHGCRRPLPVRSRPFRHAHGDRPVAGPCAGAG